MLLSVQFSRSVVSNSLWHHEPQHAMLPCPSPTPTVHPNPCPLCWWCHPTISSSVVPFSSCLQSFPVSGSLKKSALRIRWPKYWSFNFSISPSNEHPGLISFRMDWLDGVNQKYGWNIYLHKIRKANFYSCLMITCSLAQASQRLSRTESLSMKFKLTCSRYLGISTGL